MTGFTVCGCALLLSCTPKSLVRLKAFSEVTQKGNFQETAELLKKKPSLYGKAGMFLYHMDVGMLYHYASLYDSSNAYLQKASDLHDALFTRSVSNEAASLLVNDNVRPYRSKPYELVLLHQACQFNYLAQNEPNEALVEARKTQLLFDEWERKNADDNHYFTDPMFHYVSSIVYDGQGATDDAMISLYSTVKAFEKGPVALPPALGNYAAVMLAKNGREQDVERLHLTVGAQAGPVPGNNESEIVLIGYAGKGPSLAEESWWGDWIKGGLLVLHHTGSDGREQTLTLPAPGLPDNATREGGARRTSLGTTVFIKIALPALKTYSSRTDFFTVQAGGSAPVRSMVLNNYDQQAARQLEDAKTSMITRTVIRTVLRTLSAQQLKKQMATQSPVANLILNLGTDVATSQLEKADTRTCFFIPKTVQIARLPLKPGNYTITVTGHDRSGQSVSTRTFTDIRVKPSQKRFLFYVSFS